MRQKIPRYKRQEITGQLEIDNQQDKTQVRRMVSSSRSTSPPLNDNGNYRDNPVDYKCQGKKDVGTLSNSLSGGTKQSGNEIRFERRSPSIVDNHPDTYFIEIPDNSYLAKQLRLGKLPLTHLDRWLNSSQGKSYLEQQMRRQS